MSSADSLRISLEKHNATFESLLRLIPAKYYLPRNDDDEVNFSKYHKNTNSKKALAPRANKRDKLDPTNQKTVVDVYNEAANKKKGKGKQLPEEDSDSSGDEDEMDVDVDIASGDMDIDNPDAERDEADEQGAPVPIAPSSIADLRARLREKVDGLKKGRGKGIATEGSAEPTTRDALLEERRVQRAAMRERRRKETRERVKGERERGNAVANGKGGDKGGGKDKREEMARSAKTTKTQLLVNDPTSAVMGSRPANSRLTNVAFSAPSTSTDVTTNVGASHQKVKLSSNPTQALSQLAARKEALAGISEEKREDIEGKEKILKATARLSGVKVHDDEARLKKAAKRKEKEKGKSRKAWDERKEAVSASMAAKAKKRSDNIAMRNERRSDKRKGISTKGASGKPKNGGGKFKGGGMGGKARPGFEGKKLGGSSGSKGRGK